jgi:hypothetical protein
MKRLALSLMVAVAALLGALGPAGVVDAYPVGSSPGITTNVPSVPPGGVFTAVVSNCIPGETVIFTFQGTSVSATCDPTTLQATATFSAPSTPGTYQVCGELTGVGATVSSNATRPTTICTSIDVVGSTVTTPGATPGGGLAATGSSGLGTTTTSAMVLISAGVLLLIVTQVRRRRSSQAPA